MGILKKMMNYKARTNNSEPRNDIQMENDGTLSKQELTKLVGEIKTSGTKDFKPRNLDSRRKIEVLPTRVSEFDKLIERGGLERGSTILISGGAGSGKTTFILESMYNACKAGEKAVYITL
ncbi:MAG: ATPase domain-containing protein, partial [Candidatus Diapherotrites archaeon]|nr:ATPase domain-containing protein [Candidatus Diapherotrites archaeon]